jgi:hypothetical protein
MVLICIFFMGRTLIISSCVFFFFLVIWTSSFTKALFSSFAVSSLEHWFLGSLDFLNFLYMLVINPLSDIYLAKIFLLFCGLPLQSGEHFFCCTEVLKFHVVTFVNPFS